MWSLFTRDPSKDFGYEVNEVVLQDEKSFWILHKGKKKSTLEQVSIFRYECKANEESYMELVKNAVKRLKTLRHPSILTFIDSLETDKYVLVVTEYVQPLNHYLESLSNLKQQQKEFAYSWGIMSVSKGMCFLNNDCNMIHANLSMSSIFVNNSADWKISNLEYLTSLDGSFPNKSFYFHKRYTPLEISDTNRRLNKNLDSWGLGCFIWEIYNGFLSDQQNLKNTGKIPKKLCQLYNSLISSNFRTRINIQDFINKCRDNGGFFKNEFIDSMIFLEEIQIKDSIEKNRFFSNLNNRLDSFPSDICKNKILPLIVTSLEYGDASSNILELLFKIGKLLNETEYQKKIVPCLIKLFSSKDRSIRSKLLKEIEEYIEFIPSNLINEQIFNQLMHGFLDSNPVIREQTVKSIFHIAHKLNSHNLNEAVIKHFKMIQMKDPEGGIRTNTIVCLGKIAGHLNPQTRQNFMLPVFMRSLRDPFPPSRIAGILSLCATQNFFTLQDCTTKIMPALCTILMDPEKQVRDHAFTSLKSFVSKIEKFSENPSLIEQMESEINTSGSNVSSKLSSGLSWAVSSLAAKLTRSKIDEENDHSSMNTNRIGNLPTSNNIKKPIDSSKDSLPIKESANEKCDNIKTNNEDYSENLAADGWDDDWGDNLLSDLNENLEQINTNNLSNEFQIKTEDNSSKNAIDNDWNGWDVDDNTLDLSKNVEINTEIKEPSTAKLNRVSRMRNKENSTTNASTKPMRGPMRLGAQKIRKNN